MIPIDTPGDSTRVASPQWTVLYDADCGFCRTALALLLRADSGRHLRPLALDTPEADRLLSDLTPEQRDASWHLVAPDGSRTSAGAAGAPALRLVAGGGLPAAILQRIPNTTERAYAYVATHRSTFSRFVPSGAKRRATAMVARRTAESARAV